MKPQPDVDPLGLLAVPMTVAAGWAVLDRPLQMASLRSHSLLLLLLVAALGATAAAEWRWREIPNAITLPGVAIAIIARVVVGASVVEGLLGLLVLGGMVVGINALHRKDAGADGLGQGAQKLVAMLGAFTGAEFGLKALLAASLVALLNIFLLRVSGERRKRVEFGPPVAVGVALLVLMAWGGWLRPLV